MSGAIVQPAVASASTATAPLEQPAEVRTSPRVQSDINGRPRKIRALICPRAIAVRDETPDCPADPRSTMFKPAFIVPRLWRSLNGVKLYSTIDDISPLAGTNVLDLTRVVAGPYCTMLLGDLGANVIKVEHPDGDETRRWGPPFIGDSKETCYFVSLNRNKKSVCVNLKHPEGLSVMYDLVKKCDVLVENYVPGKLDKLGLGYGALNKIAPRLIYCSVTGYGPIGPYANRPGYDVIAAAVGGLMSITGEEFGKPVKVGVAMTDIATGMHAYGSIMAAMLLRNRTGKGQKIDCSLLATQVSSLINLGSNYLNAGVVAGRYGTAHASIVPYQAFATKNGYLIIGTGSDKQFQALCSLLNIEHIPKEEKFATNTKRVNNRKELCAILEDIMSTKSNEEWMDIFKDAPFPCGPVNTMDKVFADPHIRHLDLVKELDHPIAGKINVVGPPTIFSDNGNRVRSRPPILGEHTDETLSDFLGYEKDKISSLKTNGAIR